MYNPLSFSLVLLSIRSLSLFPALSVGMFVDKGRRSVEVVKDQMDYVQDGVIKKSHCGYYGCRLSCHCHCHLWILWLSVVLPLSLSFVEVVVGVVSSLFIFVGLLLTASLCEWWTV